MATLNIKSLPDDLYRRLRDRARRQHRSLSQEVIHILETHLEADEPLSILDLQGLGKETWGRTGRSAAEHVEHERAAWD